jgi:pimeloyl-ACP methyl ester carboxylesterase
MNIKSSTIALANGPRLHYVEHGDRDGVPAILLHGLSDSWRSFERALPHLPRSIRVIAPSQRGHGDSERPASGYRPSDFAADLAALMDALAIPRAVIVGHSMGAAIAERFVLDHPERALGLALVGAFRNFRDNAAVRELWNGAVAGMSDPIDVGFVNEFQRACLVEAMTPDFFALVVKESLKVPARVWRATLAGLMSEDCEAARGRIVAPTMILWGARDAFATRAEQDAIAAAIPGARLTAWPEAGHSPHWENPAGFALELTTFVARRVLPSLSPMLIRPAA